LYVYLDREQLVWQDSLSKVYVSGILPQVDSVEHYIQERIVTRELTRVVKEQSKWSVGVTAGYGLQFGDVVRTAPYVGVGVSYNLLSW
jgi:opacity protein-like surface antigen